VSISNPQPFEVPAFFTATMMSEPIKTVHLDDSMFNPVRAALYCLEDAERNNWTSVDDDRRELLHRAEQLVEALRALESAATLAEQK